MKATLHTDSYAGHHQWPIEIIKETPKKYRVKLLSDAKLPGPNNWRNCGEIVLVPKSAVSSRSGKE